MATGIGSWSTTAASNGSADSNINAAEGMPPSAVNDSMRQMMKSVADWLRDAGWIEFKEYTWTYASATSVTVAGQDVTAYFPAGRPVRAAGSSTGTIYGRVRSSSFSTNTTINFDWDSGSLSNETLAISVGLFNVTGQPTPSDFVRAVNMSKATDVSASSSMNIWSGLGNSLRIPGTATISAFSDAPRPGAFRFLQFGGAAPLVNSATLVVNDGEDYTAKTNDFAMVWAEGTATFHVRFFPREPDLSAGAVSRGFVYYTSDTSFSYASVIPANVSRVVVELWGGGGGGGGGHTSSLMRGAGGGGGGYSAKTISVASLSAITVITIGSGGAGSTNGTSDIDGSAGTTTSFGAHFSATGGSGGSFASGISQLGGVGGAGSGGDINLTGQTGGLSSPQAGSGTLGEILFGFGGDCANGGAGAMSNVGVAGLSPGGGGSGGNQVAGSAGNGAAGAAKISW